MIKPLSIITLLLHCVIAADGQTGILKESRSDNIRSVKLHRPEWNLSYPLISLSGNEKLLLSFDLLGDYQETFNYTFIHCDRNWVESEIFPEDYLTGFTENQVETYKASFNTTVSYINYSLTFPNQDVGFRKSGNYVVKVYPFGNPDSTVLVKRFMISEDKVSVEPRMERPKLARFYNTGQQVDFVVNHRGLFIPDPVRTVSATLLQNGRWDNAVFNLKPDFLGNNSLIFNDLSGKTIFQGGSEFRYFDIKSLRYQTEYIKAIENQFGSYHVYLMPSGDRSASQYFYNKDFNGKYYIAIQEGRDFAVEADYVYVYFTLPSRFPVKNGDVYLFGELSDWGFSESNRMRYNTETSNYECTMLLKQGWYNYIYAVRDAAGKKIDQFSFENNHFETENDYLVLIYLSEPMERYDRLIGYKIKNTLTGVD